MPCARCWSTSAWSARSGSWRRPTASPSPTPVAPDTCDWNTSLLCVFQSRDVASKIASGFSDRTLCAGLLAASRAFAISVTEVTSAMPRPKVLIWGRKEDPSVDIFDPVSTTLMSKASDQQWRVGAASALISGRLFVCGGHPINGRPSSNLVCFDPLPGIWQTLPPMSQARCRHAAAVFGARLYVCGGYDSSELDSAIALTRRATRGVHFQTCIVNVFLQGWR